VNIDILQITEDTSFVLPTDCQDPDILFEHLVSLIQERDSYAEVRNYPQFNTILKAML